MFDLLAASRSSAASRDLSPSVVIVCTRHVEVHRTQIAGHTSDVFVGFVCGRAWLFKGHCLVTVLATVSAGASECCLGGTLASVLLLATITLSRLSVPISRTSEISRPVAFVVTGFGHVSAPLQPVSFAVLTLRGCANVPRDRLGVPSSLWVAQDRHPHIGSWANWRCSAPDVPPAFPSASL